MIILEKLLDRPELWSRLFGKREDVDELTSLSNARLALRPLTAIAQPRS